jgi:hypothetical protein
MNPTPHLPLNGYFVAQKELTLAGTVSEVRLLIPEILHGDTTKSITLAVPDDPPAPYDGYLESIQIVGSDGLVQIEFADATLIIKGSAAARKLFATYLFQEINTLDHPLNFIERPIKLTNCPDCPFLATDSLALVLNIVRLGPEYNDADISEQDIPKTKAITCKPNQRPFYNGLDSMIGTI